MRRLFRAILPLLLVAVTTLLVSCGEPSSKVPLTYTPERIAAIQESAAPVQSVRERMSELQNLIQEKDWVYTDNFIHGPLGFLRQDMRYVSEKLLPSDEKKAKKLSKDFFADIVKIDAAAKNDNYSAAVSAYGEALRDFDAFLNLVPDAE
ncbi:MAG: photosystem II protein PsbQ [Moorea sp. SIO2B7]|nr:photosystem II protein PsbQ [Moorena sp. SIO2B7]